MEWLGFTPHTGTWVLVLCPSTDHEIAMREPEDQSRSASGKSTPETSGGMSDREWPYPHPTPELAERRSRLAPGTDLAFRAFSKSVFADGALPSKTKQLIAVAVAHVTQCPYCIRSHTGAAQRKGATPEEIMEAIWVAAEMRAGGAYAHSVLALDVIAHEEEWKSRKPDDASSRRS
jgi:AhpD family alkylhydroperoxidase